LRDDGNFKEALDEFFRIAENSADAIDKAGVLLNVAATLQAMGEYEQARRQLTAARSLMPSSEDSSGSVLPDHRLLQLELSLDLEDADISSYEGKIEEALTKFDLLLKKYAGWLKEPELRESYETIQLRRGFILADLGRYKEATTILEEAESFVHRNAELYFYLGHSYLGMPDYKRAIGKFADALKLGLPRNLEYRAHCELGIANFRLGDYVRAKMEFEKSAETADAEYIQQAQIWKWLEQTSGALGLKDLADRYSKKGLS